MILYIRDLILCRCWYCERVGADPLPHEHGDDSIASLLTLSFAIYVLSVSC